MWILDRCQRCQRQQNPSRSESMNPKLLSSVRVPPGFEVVIDNADVEMGKIWNLWWNITLSDDPESWDAEITSINSMQETLKDITTDDRLIRAHMAEFCRRHPLFPHSIDILCQEIGESRVLDPVKIGCEGRGLLDTLGYHDSEQLIRKRKAFFALYKRSLEKWLTHNRPETPTDFKVFQFLGQPSAVKNSFVEKVMNTISGEPSASDIRELCEAQCRKSSRTWERDWVPFPFKCFNCQEGCPEGAFVPTCPCCDGMVLDAGLLCAGECSEQTMAHEFRQFIEEYTLVYVIALNSWLTNVHTKTVSPLKGAHYTTEDGALEIIERVHTLLSEKSKTKEWLATCLLKTIKSRKGYPEDGVKRTELVDRIPDTCSWLREILV